jgi:hypothetical protein
MQVFFHTYYFVLPLFIIEGPPQFGMTPENVTIGDHTSVNYRVMDIYLDNRLWRFYSKYRSRL